MSHDLRATRYAVLSLFAINGWLYASWAARIPEIQSRYGIDDATMGFVLISASLGAFGAMPFAAYVNARLGVRRVALYSALLYAVAVPLIPAFSAAGELFAVYVLLGLGFGLLDVAMNTQAVEVEKRYGRAIVSSFHAGFSAAMIAGALASSLVIYLGLALEIHLAGAALVAGAALAWAYPRLLGDDAFAAAASADAGEPAFRLPARATWLLGAIGFCSMMSEASIADWSAKYMLEVAFSAEVYAPWALAAFSVAMTLGRVFGDRLRDRLGDARLLRGGSALALLGIALALAIPQPPVVIAGAALVGTGLAVAVPIIFSLAGSVPGVSPSAALAMVTTISYLGLFLGPAVIGFLAEEFGLRAGYGFIAGVMTLMLALTWRVRRPRPITRQVLTALLAVALATGAGDVLAQAVRITGAALPSDRYAEHKGTPYRFGDDLPGYVRSVRGELVAGLMLNLNGHTGEFEAAREDGTRVAIEPRNYPNVFVVDAGDTLAFVRGLLPGQPDAYALALYRGEQASLFEAFAVTEGKSTVQNVGSTETFLNFTANPQHYVSLGGGPLTRVALRRKPFLRALEGAANAGELAGVWKRAGGDNEERAAAVLAAYAHP